MKPLPYSLCLPAFKTAFSPMSRSILAWASDSWRSSNSIFPALRCPSSIAVFSAVRYCSTCACNCAILLCGAGTMADSLTGGSTRWPLASAACISAYSLPFCLRLDTNAKTRRSSGVKLRCLFLGGLAPGERNVLNSIDHVRIVSRVQSSKSAAWIAVIVSMTTIITSHAAKYKVQAYLGKLGSSNSHPVYIVLQFAYSLLKSIADNTLNVTHTKGYGYGTI